MSQTFMYGVVAALLAAAPAFAQQSPAPAAAQPLGGPQVPGVCLLSQQAVLANAKVGAAATARLQQLAQQIRTEVEAEDKPIQADARALEAQRANLKPADFQQREQALAARVQAARESTAARSRGLELTREKALARIAGEAQPLIAQVYKTHSCGLLIDRSAVLGGNMNGDLTAEVVQALDATISTITFDLETPTAPTAGAVQSK